MGVGVQIGGRRLGWVGVVGNWPGVCGSARGSGLAVVAVGHVALVGLEHVLYAGRGDELQGGHIGAQGWVGGVASGPVPYMAQVLGGWGTVLGARLLGSKLQAVWQALQGRSAAFLMTWSSLRRQGVWMSLMSALKVGVG